MASLTLTSFFELAFVKYRVRTAISITAYAQVLCISASGQDNLLYRMLDRMYRLTAAARVPRHANIVLRARSAIDCNPQNE